LVTGVADGRGPIVCAELNKNEVVLVPNQGIKHKTCRNGAKGSDHYTRETDLMGI
jgi:hypothetical protein